MSKQQDCVDRDQLLTLLIGGLQEQESAQMREHLANCSKCQALARSLDSHDAIDHPALASHQEDASDFGGEKEPVRAETGDLSVDEAAYVEAPETALQLSSSSFSTPQVRPEPLGAEIANFLKCVRPAENSEELGRLGNFRLLKLLGYGGMGAVFLAQDTELDRKVALKIVRAEVVQLQDGKERFLREARAAAKIRHQNVVAIYQVGQENGIPFLAQEFLEGETLFDRLEKKGQLTVSESASIARQIAAGLTAAHKLGLIHRDIKPGNIWLEDHGDGADHVKILDFGLARTMGDSDQLTEPGMILGTPSYMAPEQADGDVLDVRADLFSLGVILYQMTTGQLPFPGKKSLEVMKSLSTITPAPVRKVNSNVPRELSDLIGFLIAKDRNDRPATAADVVKQLAVFEEHLSKQALLTATGNRSGFYPGRWILAGFAAFFILLLSTIWIVVKNNKGEVIEIIKVPEGGSATIGPLTAADKASDVPHRDAAKHTGVPSSLVDEKSNPRSKLLAFEKPWFGQWVKDTSQLPADKQIKAVAMKLMELNPGFDGKITDVWGNAEPSIEEDGVAAIGFSAMQVTDLSPLRAFAKLKHLRCFGKLEKWAELSDLSPLQGMQLSVFHCEMTRVNDLSPLIGMPLSELGINYTLVSDIAPVKGMKSTLLILDVNGTQVADLSPLQGMQLIWLQFNDTRVRDLSPLSGMPLVELGFSSTPVSDLSPLKGLQLSKLACHGTLVTDLTPAGGLPLKVISFTPSKIQQGLEILRQMKTLERIGDSWDKTLSADDFWKKYDAGEFGKPQ